jgi:hypothetical protein
MDGVTSSGRVWLQAHALPSEIAVRIDRRIAWLEAEIPTLNRDLHLAFPPVEILPLCLMSQLSDGTRTCVPARVRLRPYQQDVAIFVIQVTAPALIESTPESILGTLAHEFLHVVYLTLEVDRVERAAAALNLPPRMEALGPGQASYRESVDSYRRLDEAHMADPKLWLDPRMQAAFATLEEEDEDANAGQRISAPWIDEGLPVEEQQSSDSSWSVVVETSILNRADLLGLRGYSP